ncbi:MAG: hypothetical protein P5702_19345 [Limnospira sp. PMC 1291.21]|uniref:Uncharacterized protein n=1 Tax=Limnospira indica PCC 8005 TaxID=376219 RepID=A0A9P1P1B2_9CYAN|nr:MULTISPECIES: hypothetical protein [Limnospira]MDC0837807.1 hypothetical protein [Limnoraphis robusta]MDT9317718.1 hypothetical protein [Limnospira sp. PMC 1306.21]MDY7055562.1 hypothetical protein [Limnospira fusiformis LS22]CDM97808.1 conserved protein of unknown function [Limnospira indica PCC 8005]MDT9179769.1 hypothetical protein [Limnospira sp. PMC 1238.20]
MLLKGDRLKPRQFLPTKNSQTSTDSSFDQPEIIRYNIYYVRDV